MTPLYFAFTNCAEKSACVLIENGADPWVVVKDKPICKYWGIQAKEKTQMSEKLLDYIEQLKPDEE